MTGLLFLILLSLWLCTAVLDISLTRIAEALEEPAKEVEE